MSNDPFAKASAGNPSASDPFGTKPSEVKTSDYPAMETLDRALLVIQPTKLETGLPNKFDPKKPKDRITADVTVIDRANPAASRTYTDMFISQGALIGQVKGFIPTKGMLLGTLRRHRSNLTPDGINTPDEVDKGVVANPRMSFAWKLADFTEEDKQVALAWFQAKAQG